VALGQYDEAIDQLTAAVALGQGPIGTHFDSDDLLMPLFDDPIFRHLIKQKI